MVNLKSHLLKREKEGKPIKVGIIGIGKMGAGVANQISIMRGIKVSITSDKEPRIAAGAYTSNGIKQEDIAVVKKLEEAQDAVRIGKPAVATDWRIIPKLDIDVVLEAIGIPELSASVAYECIMNKKHIIAMGAEADIAVGPYLAKLAKNAGIVYSQTSGDEPGVFKEIYDFADSLGFTIVCLGKTPVFSPPIKEATPDSVSNEATAQGIYPKMFCSFKDGTKTQIELTSTGNACGLVPDVRGGHNREATLDTLAQIYRLKKDGGILNRYGIVDACQAVYNPDGSVDLLKSTVPGVFGVITTDHPKIYKDIKRYLRKYLRGDGPTFVLYRPYHLCNVETPISLARAVLFNEATCSPIGMFTEVITIAKKDLKPGEILDGGGGFTVYGRMEKHEIAKKDNLLPFSLAQKIKMVKAVKKDEALVYSDVELDESSFILKLRRIQDVTL